MNNMYSVAILAGGLGTRLHPITEKIPKVLLPINGEPFIFHQLRLLKKQGINRVVLCVGYLGQLIEKQVGFGEQFDLEIHYVSDGVSLLGTAGALKNAMHLLGDNFFVLYGDSYLPCNYKTIQTAYQKSQKLALMTVYRNQNIWDASNVHFYNGEILAYDKQNKTLAMQYIDYGLSLFNKRVFQSINSYQAEDLVSVYQLLLQQGQLAGYVVQERFYEIGSFAGIDDFTSYISNLTS